MAALLNQIRAGAFVTVTSKNPTVLSGRSAYRELGWSADRGREQGLKANEHGVVCQPEIFLLNLMSSPLRVEILEDKQRIRLETWPPVICLSYLSLPFSLSLDFLSFFFLPMSVCVCQMEPGSCIQRL